VKANIPIYLYPFLNTVSKSRQSEYLRLTSLGVIGSLVKVDDPAIIHYLLQTEIIPLCLRIMEKSSELAKTIATFVMQKILLDEEGLKYICEKPERFFAVSQVLSIIVKSQVKMPAERLIKHVARCYLRFSDNKRAKMALANEMPKELFDPKITKCLEEGIIQSLQAIRNSAHVMEANVIQYS
jgi:CCR4-NOT transcription complex subunit 9